MKDRTAVDGLKRAHESKVVVALDVGGLGSGAEIRNLVCGAIVKRRGTLALGNLIIPPSGLSVLHKSGKLVCIGVREFSRPPQLRPA